MIKSTDTVYISGPMSDYPDNNRRSFEAAEAYLKQTFGCKVLNPARHPDGLSYCQYMALAMQDIEAADVVVLLHGFEGSPGATIERAVARHEGKLVLKNVVPALRRQS